MTSILLMLLLPVIRVQRVSPVPTCPTACVVCSEDAVICQRLAHIIDAPDSTQALLLTDGSISAVQPSSLSDLTNITVIGLSHNRISELGKEAFRNLPFLRTLLLDHNLLTGQALQGGALARLTQLEVLALGHNSISMIQADWFQGTKALRSLKLEGNLLNSLDSGSFPPNDLRELESLDLSDNLIDHLDRNSFRGLVSLRTLDLSRNRLSSAPAEAFSYLSWLTDLNLDLNSWNCSCQLLELAAFLSTFIQQPDKTLYNGRRMVCVSADNPAVTTVLELTEANCVPSNQNITLQIEARGSVTPQLYARDLAITAIVCFIGGVSATLLVVLIYHQVSRRRKLKESQILKEEEEGSSTVANHHVNRRDVSERKRDVFLQANGHQPWNKEGATSDGRTDGPGVQFRSRADDAGGYFRCPNCCSDGPRPNPMRRDNRTEAEEDRERRRGRTVMEDGRRRTETSNKLPPHGNMNSSAHLRKEMFAQRTEVLTPYQTVRESDTHRTDMEATSRGYETLHCDSCQRTYGPPEQNPRPGRTYAGPRNSTPFDGLPSEDRLNDRGRNLNDHADIRRETRNVTFDLESPRSTARGNRRGEDGRPEEAATFRDKERGRDRRHKVQSGQVLQVKLNLNPLRRSKVHPKRKNEQSHWKSSPKRSKEKRASDGKEREEMERKGKSAKKMKHSSKKMRKSSKNEGSTEEEKEEDDAGQKTESSSKQKKKQESTEDEQEEKTQPADIPGAADQSAAAYVTGQGASWQSVQYQGAGVTQLPSQHAFSVVAADRNCAANLSLPGSAGSQLTGSSRSLQGGRFLSSGSNALLPGGPAGSFPPTVAFSGPNVAPGGAPLGGAPLGVASSVPALVANTVHANPGTIQTPLPLNLAAHPAVNPAPVPAPVLSLPQSQLPPDASRLVAGLKPDPAQGPGVQTGEGLLKPPTEPQAARESQSGRGEDDVSPVSPHNLQTATAADSVSNNTQTDGGRVIGTSAGGVALSKGPPVGGPADSMQAAGASAPAQSGSSAGAALLQQEYLSEEGGSSPRRKLRLVLPEKMSGRPPSALERKIR